MNKNEKTTQNLQNVVRAKCSGTFIITNTLTKKQQGKGTEITM